MLLQDLRYAARLLLRRPGFTAVAVLIIGLGIGATTTVFSWAEALLLNPLPGVANADRLLVLHGTMKQRTDLSVSYPNFVDLRDHPPKGVEGIVAQRLEPATMRAEAAAERVWTSLVSGNYFRVVGVRAAVGRTFSADEDVTPEGHPVVVLSHRFWQRRFQSSPSIVGRTIMLNEHAFTVVGVAAPPFQGTVVGVASDMFVPLAMQKTIMGTERLTQRGNSWLKVLLRLAPGVPADQARAGFDVAARQLAQHPENVGRGIAVFPLWRAPSEASGMMAPVLAVLMTVVGLVLLITCANLASLLLVRATAREREIAMRLALGAGRLRLTQQLLTENLLLASLGGMAGLTFAHWSAGLLTAFLPPTRIPLFVDAGISPRVFAFAAATTVLTGMAFGLLPAWQSSRTRVVSGLRGDVGLHRRSTLRKGLVVAQVALSLVLLVTAALFLRTLGNAKTADTGFSLRQGIVASLDLVPAGYDPTRGRAFYRQVTERVGALPGVRSAAVTERLPLSLGSSDMIVEVEGYQPGKNEDVDIYYARVGPGYFKTMGIPVLAGRPLDERDTFEAPGAVTIDEEMARHYWAGRRALGGRVRIGDAWYTVVGVVKSGKYEELNESPKPFMYLSGNQFYKANAILVVSSDRDPSDLLAAVQREVRKIDARVPVFDVMTLEEHLQMSVFLQRMAAVLLGLFGLLALLLATIGLYGVLAHLAAQRTREIGVRLALGAERGEIVRLMVKQGLGVTIAGLAIGLVVAAAGTRLLATQLIGVKPMDPLSFAATAGLLLAAALLASYMPARRAARQDPLEALRYE